MPQPKVGSIYLKPKLSHLGEYFLTRWGRDMNFKTLCAMAGAIAFIPAANAADFSASGSYKDGYIPYATWTGFYVGVNGGYGGADWKGNSEYLGSTANYITSALNITGNGGFGGGQLGYNKQFNSVVLGFEADIEGGKISGQGQAVTIPFDINGTQQYLKNNTLDLDYFGTVRGRLGYAFGNFLPYVTGGFAWGHVAGKTTVLHDPTTVGSFIVADQGSVSEDQTGWVVGAGIETAITPHWTLKAEYQHIDLGSAAYRFAGTGLPGRNSGRV